MPYIKKEPARRTVLVARKDYLSGFWSDLGSKVKTAFTTSADIYHQYKAGEAPPTQPVMVESGSPSWLMPVALIGGGGLLLYVIMKRRG